MCIYIKANTLDILEDSLKETIFDVLTLKYKMLYSPHTDGPIYDDISKLDAYIAHLEQLRNEINQIKSYM